MFTSCNKNTDSFFFTKKKKKKKKFSIGFAIKLDGDDASIQLSRVEVTNGFCCAFGRIKKDGSSSLWLSIDRQNLRSHHGAASLESILPKNDKRDQKKTTISPPHPSGPARKCGTAGCPRTLGIRHSFAHAVAAAHDRFFTEDQQTNILSLSFTYLVVITTLDPPSPLPRP